MTATRAPTTNGTGAASVPVRLPTRKPSRPKLTPQPHSLLEAIIYAASDPAVDIAKVEHLIRLRRELEEREAEHAFNNALMAAQAELQPVVADAVNPHANGHKYATYAQLDRAIRPVYTKHGLSMTFDTDVAPVAEAIVVVAVLSGHGHSRTYRIVMPADGKGARGGDVMSRTHATASAVSYGMRYVSVMAFNLAIDRDDDGNAAGKPASSAGLKRNGAWEGFLASLKSCRTLAELGALWDKRLRFEIKAWPAAWREQAIAAKDARKLELADTLVQLQRSADDLHYAEHELRNYDKD